MGLLVLDGAGGRVGSVPRAASGSSSSGAGGFRVEADRLSVAQAPRSRVPAALAAERAEWVVGRRRKAAALAGPGHFTRRWCRVLRSCAERELEAGVGAGGFRRPSASWRISRTSTISAVAADLGHRAAGRGRCACAAVQRGLAAAGSAGNWPPWLTTLCGVPRVAQQRSSTSFSASASGIRVPIQRAEVGAAARPARAAATRSRPAGRTRRCRRAGC